MAITGDQNILIVTSEVAETFWRQLASRPVSEGRVEAPDLFAAYEVGLERLLQHIGPGDPRHADALVYQQRLMENIAQSRRYGDTQMCARPNGPRSSID